MNELAESHGLVIQEKSITSLRPVDWPDEATFSAEINRIFKVKAGKSGAKFWKGVREAVMKQCTTHDLVLVFQSPGMEAEEAGELHLGQSVEQGVGGRRGEAPHSEDHRGWS